MDSDLVNDTKIEIEILADILYCNDLARQLSSVVKLRKSLKHSCPLKIEQVIAWGVIPRLVQLLSRPDNMLKLEATSVLKKITTGEHAHVQALLDAGAVHPLISLLSCKSQAVRNEAMRALVYIARDGPSHRDHILREGALPPIVALLSKARDSDLRGAWVIETFCESKISEPDWKLILPALPLLATRLLYSLNQDTLLCACRSLASIALRSHQHMRRYIKRGICPRFVDLLAHTLYSVQVHVLIIIGCIAKRSDDLDLLITCGLLPALQPLLSSSVSAVRSYACWAISNIESDAPHIQAVIDAHLVPALIDACGDADISTARHACWAVKNATLRFFDEESQVRYLVACGCIQALCNSLQRKGIAVLQALVGLANILYVGWVDEEHGVPGAVNMYAQYVEEAGGINTLCELQTNEDKNIRTNVRNILEMYFPDVIASNQII